MTPLQSGRPSTTCPVLSVSVTTAAGHPEIYLVTLFSDAPLLTQNSQAAYTFLELYRRSTPDMTPTRQFGNPSRAINSKPYERLESPSKLSTKPTKSTIDLLLNKESVENAPLDYATRYSQPPSPLEPTNLNSLELSLPPFKIEPSPLPDVLTSRQIPAPEGEESPEDQHGMPTHAQWKTVVSNYLAALHHRKRDKALITQEMHGQIFETLTSPDSTRIGTPQFRFWARKMFALVETGGVAAVTHGGRPVAVKEHIYDILCMCHAESGHAGRDKTCKVLREYYTWIPKELTANFVKSCPTCAKKRSFDATTTSLPETGELVTPKIDFDRCGADTGVSSSQLFLPKLEREQLLLTGPLISDGPSSTLSQQAGSIEGQQNTDLCMEHTLPTPNPGSPTLRLPPQLTRRSASPLESDKILSTSENTSFSTNVLPPHDESFPIPTHTSSLNYALPPLNRMGNYQYDPSECDSLSKLASLVSEDLARANLPQHTQEYDGSGNTLPPLMQYLSKGVGEHVYANLYDINIVAGIPVDPALLASGESHSQLHPQLHLPAATLQHTGTSNRAGPPPPLDFSLTQTNNGTSAWDGASAGDGGSSATSASMTLSSEGVLTPANEGPTLHSPVPVKLGDRTSMLAIAAETYELGLVGTPTKDY